MAVTVISECWLACAYSANMRSPANPKSVLINPKEPIISRRETLKSWASLFIATTSFAISEDALAFPNRISTKYDDRPKQRGAVPKGLGVGMRKDMAGDEYTGLKPCGAGKLYFDYIGTRNEHSYFANSCESLASSKLFLLNRFGTGRSRPQHSRVDISGLTNPRSGVPAII